MPSMRLGWNRSRHETTMIYIVLIEIPYEGSTIEGVFLDEGKAIDFARRTVKQGYRKTGVVIEEWEDGGVSANRTVSHEE